MVLTIYVIQTLYDNFDNFFTSPLGCGELLTYYTGNIRSSNYWQNITTEEKKPLLLNQDFANISKAYNHGNFLLIGDEFISAFIIDLVYDLNVRYLLDPDLSLIFFRTIDFFLNSDGFLNFIKDKGFKDLAAYKIFTIENCSTHNEEETYFFYLQGIKKYLKEQTANGSIMVYKNEYGYGVECLT